MSDKKQVKFTVDEDTYEELDRKLNEYGEKTEYFRKCAKEKAYGADQTERERLRENRRSVRQDIQDLQEDRKSIDNEIETLQNKLERIEERLDALHERDGEYDGMLQMIEERLWSGKPVDKSLAEVTRAAEAGGREEHEVISDLKERNPKIPEDAFQERDASQYNWKIESDAWDARKDEPVNAE